MFCSLLHVLAPMVNMECEFYFLTFLDVQEDLDLDSELGNRDLHEKTNLGILLQRQAFLFMLQLRTSLMLVIFKYWEVLL